MPTRPEDAFAIREFRIPLNVLREFKQEPRIIWRDGFPIGIPVPDLRTLESLRNLKGFEVVLVPTDVKVR